MKLKYLALEAKTKCPAPTQDITLNLKNRQTAIDEYGYGPADPSQENKKFWQKKMDMWNTDSADELKNMICGTCAAFDITKKTLDCIDKGIGGEETTDSYDVIDAGQLGYCRFLKFKCAAKRTCDAWVTGGPLKKEKNESVNEATPEEEDEFHRNLDKLVHKTFGHSSDEKKMNEANEPDIISQLRDVVKNGYQTLKDPKSGKKMKVDSYSASAVTQVYDALKQQSNKDKFVSMGLVGMVNMAFKLLNKQEIVEYDVETLEELNDFHQFMKEYKVDINEAEYQGRKVKLGKPMQGDVKKFKVYVKNDKGNVVKVNFGQKGMNIKKDNPDARKSFRARHNCDNPGPRWKARYWSCRKW